jgi:hypothetical protein
MTQRPAIRFLDLRLRAEFPHVSTEIHELDPYRHVIFASRDQLDALTFAPVFADRYRMVCDLVEFTNERPPASKLIEPIGDDEIGSELEGLSFSWGNLLSVLAGKFPTLPPISRLCDGQQGEMRISFERDIPSDLIEPVRLFLERCLRGRPLVIEVAAASPEPVPSPSSTAARHAIQSMEGLNFKPIYKRSQVPSFVAREEEWWFNNLENLFEGRLSPRSFAFTRDAGMACYLNSTVFPQIDLRQLLLAYDTIYLEPPLSDDPSGQPSSWGTQNLGRDDLLKLVAADRVRILHSQPEERSDLGLLREAQEANPNGVIGRRQSAAIMIADIVETANEYLLAQPSLAGEVQELIGRIGSKVGSPNEEIARSLLYPVRARRECLQPLMNHGLMAYHSIGQGEAFADAFQRVRGKDVRLQAGSFGSGIHTAHMLKATFIPPMPQDDYVSSWIGPMQFMGDRLNFYSSLNTRIAAAWATNERGKEERRVVLPPVPLFEFDHQVPIEDILSLTPAASDRRKGRALIARLADLPTEERESEIARLNAEYSRTSRAAVSRQHAVLAFDSGFSVGTYALGVTAFPFMPALTLTQIALDCARRAPALDAIIDEIEQAFAGRLGRNEDLHFLSKVSRVAQRLTVPKGS